MAWNWQPVKQEQEAAGNWNWQPARVAEQTVLDDDTGQIYRAPVTFDEQDIRFAIATQVNKEPKRDFIGKVRYAAGEAWNWAEKFSDRVESGFQSAERGIVGLGGQALDTFLHASLSVPERTEQIEKYKSGDFSDWDASLNGRVTDEDIANETDPALKAAMQFRKDRQDALIARAEERLEQRQRIRRKLDASIRKWQEVLRPEAEMDGYDRFMEAMGSGAASVGLSVATLAATKNPQVAAGIMAGVFGRMRYTDVFDKSIEKGLDYATADDYATIAGTIEGGIELALEPFLYGAANLRPVRKITDEMISRTVAKLNATAGGKSAARKIVSKHRQSVGKQGLKAGVIEGGEEALQDMGGAYFENYTGLENTPQEEIMARALLSFAVGGLTGAGAAVVGTSVYNREAAATNERIKQSLTQAYPELTAEENQKTADALQEIFYQDGEGRMLNELELLADKENDPDTLESGKHEISEDMRSILKKRYQMSDEEIDRTAEVAVASIDLRNQFNEAQTAFYDGLVNVGVKPNVAEPFSRLMAARASAVAMNEKKTVKDVLERWNLKFERKTRPIDYNALLDDEILFQSEVYDGDGRADINVPEFKAWFGNSKVVDEASQPLKMVHFSNNEFSQFDKSRAGLNNDESSIGFWFADRENFAFNNENHPVKYDVYLKMENPLIIEGSGTETNPWADTDIDNLDSYAKFEKMFYDIMYQDPQMWDERVYEPIYGGFETQKVKVSFSNLSDVRKGEVIKGIIDNLKAQGYDGIIIKNTKFDSLNPDEGINQYVVFEPNQIKSVYNRGTWDAGNDNIYYQGQIADKTKNLFRPVFGDIKKFAETLKKAIKGELKPQTMLQVVSSTPEVYKRLGVDDKALNLPQNVLRKINIGKHDVPLSIIEQLPELVSNPLVVLDSKTEEGSFVSVLDAVDANGNTVVAVIRPTDRAYNVIPSVYGKEQVNNLIESSNIRYVDDIEKPATASIDLSSLRLRGGDSARGNNNNILQKSDIVNSFMQNNGEPQIKYNATRRTMLFDGVDPAMLDKKQPRGAYDAAKRLITLFEGADPSTLVHEAAHFFLDDMRRFADNETTAAELQAIYRYVGSADGVLTTEQHEYFARSFEAYLMEGKAPNSLLGRVFEKFRKWLRTIYSQIKNLNVKLDDNIRKTFDEMLGGRKLDFALQLSRERMAEDIKAGNIGQTVINKALRLLEEGKMSKADMEEMIGRLEDGRLKRSDVKKYLEPFAQSTSRHHEAVYEQDYQRYRRRLEKGNVTPAAVRKKIDRLLEWTKPRTQNGKVVGRFPDIKVNRFFDAVRENINLKRDEALAKIDANLQRLDEITQKGMSGEDGNFRNVSDIIWENKVLAIPAGRASVGLMADVYNDIAEIYNTGRLSERVTGMVKRAWRERLIGEAVAVLDQGQGTNWRRESSDLAKRMRRFGLSMFSWNGIRVYDLRKKYEQELAEMYLIIESMDDDLRQMLMAKKD